jgi:hypothetical protein
VPAGNPPVGDLKFIACQGCAERIRISRVVRVSTEALLSKVVEQVKVGITGRILSRDGAKVYHLPRIVEAVSIGIDRGEGKFSKCPGMIGGPASLRDGGKDPAINHRKLKECYEGHFAKLYQNRLGSFAMNEFEVAGTLEKMAALTGNQADVQHWKKLIRRDPPHIRRMFEQRWEMNGVSGYFAAPNNGMIMTNGFWAMRSPYFPNEYAKAMVDAWALDREKGFFGEFFPLAMSKHAMKTFKKPADYSFGYTPDTAYFTLDGIFRQHLVKEATELTLNHLENYNYHTEWQIPVAPEAYKRDRTLFGDQYSNFNAGKILLYLEGLAGLKYSIPEKNSPSALPCLKPGNGWRFVFRLPASGPRSVIPLVMFR